MRAWTILLPLAMFASLSSCSSDEGGQAPSRLCTPGANVFCRCKDPSSEGTKRCADDGQSFSECDCGEVEDTGTIIEEDTGTPPPDDTGTPPADTATDTGPANAEEKCPGKAVAVDPMKEVVINGDTSTATNDSTGTGACAVAASKDHVYAVIPTGSGKLAIKLTGAGAMDPTLYVRETDCTTGQLACAETTGAAGSETVNVNVTTGKTYYVWADGKAGTEGAYTLTLNLTTGAFCGDGTVDNGEGCDDGNKIAGDGCENDCRPSGNVAAADACPGVTGHVWPGKTLTFTGDTSAANLSYESTGCSFGANAPDRVYALVAHKTGTMTVEVDASHNVGFYVRRAPCATGMEVTCANDVGASTIPQTEKKSFAVTNDTTYYLVVDGALTAKGTFTVKASVL